MKLKSCFPCYFLIESVSNDYKYMAPSLILLYILVMEGFLPVLATERSVEQTGLYFIQEPEDVIAVKNEPLTLQCSAKSVQNNELTLSWIHDGFPLIPDGRRQLLSNGSLFISKIIHKKNGYSDQGEYRCLISEGNGFLSSKSIYLRVSVMRNFTEHPKSQTVAEGSHVRMSCQIDSLPDAVITWDRDDHVLLQQSLKHVILSGPGINGSIIYIFNVGSEDAGKYGCTAVNPLTKNQRQSKRAILTILHGEYEKETEPTMTSPNQLKIVREGDDVVLDCAVDKPPFPSLMWTLRKKGANNAISVFNTTTTGYNIAHMKNIKAQQSGLYVCSFVYDSSAKMGIELRVMTYPEFIERPETVTYQAARAIRFRCNVLGNPIPLIKWVKDGFSLNITGRITENTRVNKSLGLRISEVLVASSLASDAGIYQCLAKNSMGVIWSATRLILNATKPPPRPPENVSCQTISSTEIGVKWHVSHEALMDGLKAFSIHYHDIDGGEELREAVLPTNRSVVLRSLSPYTNYTFYLRSYGDSASDFSEQVICQTDEEVPTVAPDVQLISSTPHSLRISWTPLTKLQARGKITEYKIQWRLSGSPSSHVQRVNGDVLKYMIIDLIPANEYEVRVLAATSKGWMNPNFPWKKFQLPNSYSPDSPPKPQIKLLAVNSSTIKAIWNIDDSFDANLEGYKLFFRKKNSSSLGPISVPVNVSEYYITNLDSETLYEVTILGFTEKADGKRGTSSIRTLANDALFAKNDNFKTVIEPPVSLEAEPSSVGIINISWSPPLSGANNIKYYTLCYYPVQTGFNFNNISMKCLKSLKTEISVTGLEPYTLYEFKVRSHGLGDKFSLYSQSVECYTFEDVPSSVTDIRWNAKDKTTIFISWKQPVRTNGIIRNYTVFYTKDSSLPLHSWSKMVVPADTYKTHITNLMPNTEYYVTVRASTNAGLGSYGSPKQVIIRVPTEIASKKASKTETDKRNEQYVGIIVGLGIGLTCIIICTFCIICRRRCVKNQASEEIEPTTNRRTNANSCQTDRELRIESRESEFFPYLSTQNSVPNSSSIEYVDTKDLYSNGFSNSVRMSLLREGKPSINSSSRGNINIIENPRYDLNYAETPLLQHQVLPTKLTGDHDYSQDVSAKSDMNNSAVSLLSKGQQLTQPEELGKLNCKGVETQKKEENKGTDSRSFQALLQNAEDCHLSIGKPLKNSTKQINDEEHNKNQFFKGNKLLENPDFRFSDSLVSDKSQFKKNGYFSAQKLYNGAADPLLKTSKEDIESTGLFSKFQSLMNPLSSEMKQDC